MNIKNFMKNYNINYNTAEHFEFYANLVEKLGKDEIFGILDLYFPDYTALAKSYNSGDIHLNKCKKYSMSYFEKISCVIMDKRNRPHINYNSPLLPIFRKHKINAFSQSDCVCIFKNAIRMKLKEMNLIKEK